ncbi:MAG: hypothetical protein HYY15_01815 [Candidatus Omnitrophica bacterium]|nr:hypothetical protein [Candidatus Omnitrophota bacterium]
MKSFPGSAPHSEAWRTIASKLKLRLISDTAIVTMPLTERPLLAPNLSTEDELAIWLEAFLFTTCIFWLWVAGKLGHFFRGGISVGQHYESEPAYQGNLFIFSQALVDATKLEKNQSKQPSVGIIIDSKVLTLGGGKIGDALIKDGWVFFLKDEKIPYLNIYKAIPEDRIQGDALPLPDIQQALTAQYRDSVGKIGVLEKYDWLIRYHNGQVGRFGRTDLLVNVK